ncbi:protein-serine/threonine phosphatase [Ranunculus cassubicifolius]
MFKSVVYHGNSLLGEVEIYYPKNQIIDMRNREIRITHLSTSSERCSPLAVLHTISPSGVCFKLQSSKSSQLFSLHSTCLRENKTAVMPFGEEELHLVAMSSRGNAEQQSRFWGFIVAPGLYNSCLMMLNLRCLGIVFDLDETLVVANTMRSFEDRIDSLQRKMNTEIDPQRLSGMLAEVIKVQSEAVPPLSDDHQPIVRPIIRLREKNIVLTRINPLIRDTSVLVRLRPAWEDLRSYLTARGRKRFEVYVCTMAERDYALEMWRLLDPESNLISPTQLLDRIVCVKAGNRKSLVNVFHDGIFHPKMALVVDDRLKVWDEKDQPRVHVVPAFAPYYAPQAEANNEIPVLCVARNVACNVRGGFFKDFDEGLLPKISEVAYEDDLADFPTSPDVSDYLMSEDDHAASGKDPLGSEGMADVEVERRLKDAISSSSVISNLDPRHAVSLQPAVASILNRILQPNHQGIPVQNQLFPPAAPAIKPLANVGLVEPSLPSSSSREEGEVIESEVDPDTRRRLLIWQHGQDTREQTSSEQPTFPVRPPPQVPTPPPQVPIQPPQVPIRPPQVPVHSRGMWPQLEENNSSRQLNQAVSKPLPKEFPLEQDTKLLDKQRIRNPSFFRGVDSSVSSDKFFHEHQNQRFPKEAHRVDGRLKQNQSVSKKRSFPVEDMSLDPSVLNNEDHPASALQKIAKKCRTTVEFKSNMIRSTELQFSIEAWFAGEKIGEGIGRTRREAQFQAAENALRHLSKNYLSNLFPDPAPTTPGDSNNKHLNSKENGFIGDLTSSVSVLKELCTQEGLSLVFQDHSPLPTNSSLEGESHAQVEIGGRVLGSGIGSTWDEAKMRAADEALETLKSMVGQGSSSSSGQQQQTYSVSPRPSLHASKRHKVEFPRVLQRLPSSLKYSNNPSPVA